jgi:hypothetical protein
MNWSLAQQMAEIDLIMEIDKQNWRMIRLMVKDICTECNSKITTQIFRNTGVCSEDCKDKRDGKVEHPTVMPPHKKMGYTRPEAREELDGILMEGSSGGIIPGSIT